MLGYFGICWFVCLFFDDKGWSRASEWTSVPMLRSFIWVLKTLGNPFNRGSKSYMVRSAFEGIVQEACHSGAPNPTTVEEHFCEYRLLLTPDVVKEN